MKHTDVIKAAMVETGVTQRELTSRLGISQSSTSERISHKNISVKNLTEILDILGYELVIQPKTDGTRPERQYVLDRESYV